MIESVKYFKALSDETRLRLLNLLIHFELNVNEITEAMSMGQSRISRHLKILTDSGLLDWRRDGLWVFYRSAREGNGREFINSISATFKNDYDLKIDLSRLLWIIEEKSRAKTEFFDSIAPDWDNIKKDITGSLDITGQVLDRIRSADTAADLGCGTGELLLALSKKARRVIGVDKSPKMLAQLKSRFDDKNGRIDLRIGAIEHLPMKDGEADTAVINMVLHHLPSPFNGIAEANRILKTGGHLYIIDLDKHGSEKMRERYGHRWLGFSRDDMENWLESAGFMINERAGFKGAGGMRIILTHGIKEKNISNLNQINIKEIYNEHEDYKRSI